ncbi:hypothetical protein P171DRAFT_495230, partial [Karstenula rhodostoma CBS 690.94]
KITPNSRAPAHRLVARACEPFRRPHINSTLPPCQLLPNPRPLRLSLALLPRIHASRWPVSSSGIMAQDRPRTHDRGAQHMQVSKDAPIEQLTKLRSDFPLGAQRHGRFIEHIDESYPQPESRWTAPVIDEKLDEVISSMPDGLTEQRHITPKILPFTANAHNWNDIPDEMLNPPSRGTKAQSKAEAIQRRKSRKRKAANRQKKMPGRFQGSPENRDLNSVGYIPAAQVSNPDPHLQKFKLKRSIGAGSNPQAHVTDPNVEGVATRMPDAVEGYDQDEDEYEWSENSDIEDIEFDDIMRSSRATSEHSPRLGNDAKISSMHKTTNAGINGGNFGAKTEHDSTKIDEAVPSAYTHPNTDDEFVEYNYLQAKAAAGEPTILPKDMLEKLRAKVKADEERRREQDPQYQHKLIMAKVNAAQAQREADIPHEALYPESASGEKCHLETENWDLLDDFEVKAQADEEDELGPGIISQSKGEMEGDVIAPSGSDKDAQSVSKDSTGKLRTIYGWASKAGNVFTSKKGPKDPQKNGWTLADILEEDERRAKH